MPSDLTTIDEQINWIYYSETSPGIDCLVRMDFGIKCSNSIRRFKRRKQVRWPQQQQSHRRPQPSVNSGDATRLLENSPRLPAKPRLLKMWRKRHEL